MHVYVPTITIRTRVPHPGDNSHKEAMYVVDTSMVIYISARVNRCTLLYVLLYVVNFPIFILCVYNRQHRYQS